MMAVSDRGSRGSAWTAVAEWAKLATVIMLAAMFAARLVGPSDAWDQTQPLTMGYTTDIVVHARSDPGRFVLPRDHGTNPATKPPLYNWIAAPFVAVLGAPSEIAHRMPSLLSMLACVALVVLVGRRISPDDPARARAIGWLAALMLPANYTLFKLGALVRPDMLLTFWLVAGWIAATTVLVGERRGHRREWAVLGFWLCVAMAGLTKGPPALVLPLYALVAARPVGGSFAAARRFGWWWGLPLAAAPTGLWLLAAAQIDVEHVMGRLLHDEIWGRATGTGPLGRKGGPIVWVTGLAHMPLYFLVRSVPWSIAAIIGAIWLLEREDRSQRRWRAISRGASTIDGRWIVAAALMAATVLLLFTLSAGKRADYIAAAYPPAAILASSWLLLGRPYIGRRRPWLAPVAAAIVIGAMAMAELSQLSDPGRSFVRERSAFLDAVNKRTRAIPLDVVFHLTGENELQALVGASEPDDDQALMAALSRGEPFWLLAPIVPSATIAPGWNFEERARFAPDPDAPRTGWPSVLLLLHASRSETPP